MVVHASEKGRKLQHFNAKCESVSCSKCLPGKYLVKSNCLFSKQLKIWLFAAEIVTLARKRKRQREKNTN